MQRKDDTYISRWSDWLFVIGLMPL